MKSTSAILAAICVSGVSAGTMGGTGVSTLNTYVAGVAPTSVAIALTPATVVADTEFVTCTYTQDVFAAVAAVTCAATPTSAGIGCTATSTKIVKITAAAATFAATVPISFALTSNLATNFATGAVGVSCVSSSDATALVVNPSFTTTQGAVGTLAITDGPALTRATGAAIAYTGILAANHVCWKAHTAVSAITAANCLVAGSATALGVADTVTCGAAGATGSFLWDAPTATNIAFIECSAGAAGFGAAADVDITVAQVGVLAVTNGLTQTIAKDAAIATTGILAASWVCFKAGTSAPALAVGDCLVAGTATAFGNAAGVVCGAAGATDSFTWDVVASTNIALIECTAAGAGTGTKLDLTLTQTAAVGVLAVTGGLTQTIAKDASIATTGILSTSWVCFKTGASAAPALATTECAVAGTAAAFGSATTVVCGAAGATDTFAWDVVASKHIALIECTGAGAGTGTKLDLTLTETAVTTKAPTAAAAASSASTVAVATGAVCLTAASLALLF